MEGLQCVFHHYMQVTSTLHTMTECCRNYKLTGLYSSAGMEYSGTLASIVANIGGSLAWPHPLAYKAYAIEPMQGCNS